MMKKIVSVLLLLCMMFACLTAVAEELTPTEDLVYESLDGVLSIQVPNAEWVAYDDPNYWFALTDGDEFILISHLSNGEALPAMMMADDEFAAVYDALVSTKNEVFVITGCAVEQEGLKEIMEAIGTVKILKLDTKQAIKPVAPTSEYEIEPYSATLYSKSKQLNVRGSWSVKAQRLGYLKKGQAAEVTGIVKRNGKSIGWYQISFKGGTGYVSAKYLSTKKNDNSLPEKYARDDVFTQDPDAPEQPEEARDDVFSQDPSAANQPQEAFDGVDTQDPLAD